MTTDEVATTPPEGRSDPSATVVHRFGKPLPADPATLSDAFGLLLREALARRGWVLAPIGLYVLMLRLLHAPRPMTPHDPAASPTLGVAIAAFLVVDGLALWLSSRRSRMAMTVLFATILVFCLDTGSAEVTTLDLRTADFLPLTLLVLYLLVQRKHDRIAALLTTLAGAAMLPFSADGGWLPDDVAAPSWLPWTAAALASCGVLFAARARTWMLSVGALAVPAVVHAAAWGLREGSPLLFELLLLHLVALAARSNAPRGRDVAGGLAVAIHRNLPRAAFVLPFLTACLWHLERALPRPYYDALPLILRQATLGEALMTPTLFSFAVCVSLLAAARARSFERLSVAPIVATAMLLGIMAVAAWELESVSEWRATEWQLVLLWIGRSVASAVIGLALAMWIRRAHAALLGVGLGAVVWMELAPRSVVAQWTGHAVLSGLAGGLSILIAWGASSRADRKSLFTFCGLGAAVALLLGTSWHTLTFAYQMSEAMLGTQELGPLATRLGDLALEVIGLGLATVLFVDCLRLARTVFTTCPVPETHVIRTDFAPEQPPRVG